jgi:signal transduction histidine kinase
MLSNETGIFFAILIAAAMLGLIFVFFMLTIVRQQKRKTALEKEQLVAELSLLENERSRIAADLHDELGALISAVKLNLECVDGASDSDQLHLDKAATHIDTTMHKIREISNNLMPQVFQREGLVRALEEMSMMLESAGGPRIQIDCDDDPILPKGKALQLYRIIQEIVNNVMKHAQASVIVIVLELNENKLTVHVTDDGVGFDSEVIAAQEQSLKGGQGLGNIRRRVDLLEGKLYLETTPGKGTQYEIEIPFAI